MSPLKSDFNELGSVIFLFYLYIIMKIYLYTYKKYKYKKVVNCALNFNCDMIKKKKGIKTMIEMNAFLLSF